MDRREFVKKLALTPAIVTMVVAAKKPKFRVFDWYGNEVFARNGRYRVLIHKFDPHASVNWKNFTNEPFAINTHE